MTPWRIQIQGAGRYSVVIEVEAKYAKWTGTCFMLGDEFGLNGNLRKLSLILPTSVILSVAPLPDGALTADAIEEANR